MAKWAIGFLIVFIVIMGQIIESDKEDARKQEQACADQGGKLTDNKYGLGKICTLEPVKAPPKINFFK